MRGLKSKGVSHVPSDVDERLLSAFGFDWHIVPSRSLERARDLAIWMHDHDGAAPREL